MYENRKATLEHKDSAVFPKAVLPLLGSPLTQNIPPFPYSPLKQIYNSVFKKPLEFYTSAKGGGEHTSPAVDHRPQTHSRLVLLIIKHFMVLKHSSGTFLHTVLLKVSYTPTLGACKNYINSEDGAP